MPASDTGTLGPPGAAPGNEAQTAPSSGAGSPADDALLRAACASLASTAPGANELAGGDVIAVTDATESMLLAVRDACFPSLTAIDLLARLLRIDPSALGSLGIDQIRSAVYAAVRGVSPVLQTIGVLPGVTAAGGSPPGGAASSGGAGSPSKPATGAASPVVDPSSLLPGTTTLPTDDELAWIQEVLAQPRYQVLRQYFTQWGPDTIKGIQPFSTIQGRLVTASALQQLAGVPDLLVSPAPAVGFTRISSSAELGNDVHDAIQSAYLVDHPHLVCADGGVFNDGDVRNLGDLTHGASTGKPALDEQLKLFADAFRELGRGRSPLRADIADLDDRTVYEIKPLSRAAEGVIQLWAYQAYLNMGLQYVPPGPGGRSLLFGEGAWPPSPIWLQISSDPIAPIYAVAFQFGGTGSLPGWVPLPGMILYELYVYDGDQEEAAQKLALLAASIIAILASRAGGGGASGSGSAANDNVEVQPKEQPSKIAARVIPEILKDIALILFAIVVLAIISWLVIVALGLIAAALALRLALGVLTVVIGDPKWYGPDFGPADRNALAASFLESASGVAVALGVDAPAPTGGAPATG